MTADPDPAADRLPLVPEPALADLGDLTRGVWTRAEALGARTAGQVDRLVRTGQWQVVWPGIYADGGFVLDAEQLGHAAVLASGGAGQPVPFGRPGKQTGRRRCGLVAVVAGRLAARVWELPLVDDDDPCTAGQDWRHSDVAVRLPLPDIHHDGTVLHRHQLTFAAGDLVQTSTGLWVTSPLRTLLDCRSLLGHEALVCALDGALHRRLVSASELERACLRIKSWRGAPSFRAAVELSDDRAESPGETLTRLVLRPALPFLVPQVVLLDHAARPIARFDLADEELQLAVEFDGRQGHAGEAMVARDRRRDRRAETRGWTTERVTWFEVRRQQAALRQRITARAAQLAARRPTSP